MAQPSRSKRADPAGASPPARPAGALRARALRLLARREHSRAELARKLAPHAVEGEDVAALLDDLAARGWISEERVAEQLAHARKARYGAERIRHDLLTRGVAAEIVARTVAGLADSEFSRACAVWRRRFGEPPRDAAEAARQMRYLAGRGFGAHVARRVVAARGVDPADERDET